MKDLKIENLKLAVNGAVRRNASYFGVKVLNETNGQTELIVNTVNNMLNGKLDYYLNAYNENLELKNNTNIKIVGFTFANLIEDIRKDLSY